jgi:hypothetical protein
MSNIRLYYTYEIYFAIFRAIVVGIALVITL